MSDCVSVLGWGSVWLFQGWDWDWDCVRLTVCPSASLNVYLAVWSDRLTVCFRLRPICMLSFQPVSPAHDSHKNHQSSAVKSKDWSGFHSHAQWLPLAGRHPILWGLLSIPDRFLGSGLKVLHAEVGGCYLPLWWWSG